MKKNNLPKKLITLIVCVLTVFYVNAQASKLSREVKKQGYGAKYYKVKFSKVQEPKEVKDWMYANGYVIMDSKFKEVPKFGGILKGYTSVKFKKESSISKTVMRKDYSSREINEAHEILKEIRKKTKKGEADYHSKLTKKAEEYKNNDLALYVIGSEFCKLYFISKGKSNIKKGLEYLYDSYQIKKTATCYDLIIDFEFDKEKLLDFIQQESHLYPNSKAHIRSIVRREFTLSDLDRLKGVEKSLHAKCQELKGLCALHSEVLYKKNILTLKSDPKMAEYFNNQEYIAALKENLKRLPKCSNGRNEHDKIVSNLGKLNKAQANQPLFLKHNIHSKIKSYPSFYRFRHGDYWIMFYFKNEEEVYAVRSGDSIKEEEYSFVISSYNKFLTYENLGHDITPVTAKGDTLNFTYTYKKKVPVSLILKDEELYTLDDTRVEYVDLTSKSPVCIAGDCVNGKGIFYDPTNKEPKKHTAVLAQGEWTNSELNGTGRIIYMDFQYKLKKSSDCSMNYYMVDRGSYYEGQFKDNKFHGYGTFRFYRGWIDGMLATDKNERIGEFKNGKFVGKVEMTSWAKVQKGIAKIWAYYDLDSVDSSSDNNSSINKNCDYKLKPTGYYEHTGDEKSEVFEVYCNGSGNYDYKIYKRIKRHTFHGIAGYYHWRTGQDTYLGQEERESVRKVCKCEE